MVRFLGPVICIMLILVASSSGCIKVVQKSVSGDQMGNETAATIEGNSTMQTKPATSGTSDRTRPSATPAGQLIQVGNRVVVVTAAATGAPSGGTTGNATTPAVVSEAVPIPVMTSDEIQHASRVNETTAYSPDEIRGERTLVFRKTYALRSNAAGLLVNVTKGPLIVAFAIETEYDCIKDPDSCKGSLIESVTRPYCIITVRDNATGTIVAQDGYAREYSGATSRRTMTIYGQGLYHITLEGSGLDVTLAITTGASPAASDAASAAGTTRATLSQAESERLRRGV